MSVRRSRDRFVVEFQQRGERVFKRLPAGITKAQAQEYETKLRRGIFDTAQLGKKPELTLEEAIGRWLLDNDRKNKKKAQSEAKQWEPWVRGKWLSQAPEVAQAATSAWQSRDGVHAGTSAPAPSNAKTPTKRSLHRKAASAATINRRLALLKAVCHHAYKQGWIGENLSGRITLLKERNKREVYLTKAEIMKLAGCAPSAASKAAIILLSYSGLRVSEFLSQTKQALRSGTFSVPQTRSKTLKPRLVPIAVPAKPALRSWLALSQVPDYWQLRKEFLVARKAAKVGPPDLRLHDLRHSAASLLINQNVDLYTVGKILGHASTQTTARYAHLADATLKKAMARLR